MSAILDVLASPECVVSPRAPNDGRDWDCRCARCGSGLTFEACEYCAGQGCTDPGELYEQDPLWYDEGDVEACGMCFGAASFPQCLSSPEWCGANPLPGQEDMGRGQVEWFTFEPRSPHD